MRTGFTKGEPGTGVAEYMRVEATKEAIVILDKEPGGMIPVQVFYRNVDGDLHFRNLLISQAFYDDEGIDLSAELFYLAATKRN